MTHDVIKRRIEEIRAEEEALVFSSFTHDRAWELGCALVEHARSNDLAVAIDIRLTGIPLFRYAFAGTNRDNDQWIRRKSNVVDYFGRSSLAIKYDLLQSDSTIAEKYFLDPNDYSPWGGSFPITITDVGVVGTITVSGLPDEEDHATVVTVLRKQLG